MTNRPKLAYKMAEAVDVTGMSADYLKGQVANKLLPAKKAGGNYLFLEEDLREWLKNLPDAV